MKKIYKVLIWFFLICCLFFVWYAVLDQQKGLSLWQKITQWWNDFWTMETMQQYSINWHYWVLVNWTSIIKYWYILFIVIALCVLIFLKSEKNKKFRILFYVWLWMFLFVWIRNTIAYTSILSKWVSNFKEDRVFYDIWDYIWFIEKVRDKLSLDSKNIAKDNCKIFIWEYWHRAIEQHWKLYLIPCKVVSTWEIADYKIYYKREVPKQDANKEVLLKFNGSYLLDNNSK